MNKVQRGALMDLLIRAKEPKVLRSELYGQSQPFGADQKISPLDLRGLSLLFRLYTDEALLDFLSWLCFLGEWAATEQQGIFVITEAGRAAQRELREPARRPTRALSKEEDPPRLVAPTRPPKRKEGPFVPEDLIRRVSKAQDFRAIESFLREVYAVGNGQPISKERAIELLGQTYGWDETDLEDFGDDCLDACMEAVFLEYQRLENGKLGYTVSVSAFAQLGIPVPVRVSPAVVETVAPPPVEEPVRSNRRRRQTWLFPYQVSSKNGHLAHIKERAADLEARLDAMVATLAQRFGE